MRIGADTIQCVNGELAAKGRQAERSKLRWRLSRGARLCLAVKIGLTHAIAPQKAVGVDMGLKDIAVTSNGG